MSIKKHTNILTFRILIVNLPKHKALGIIDQCLKRKRKQALIDAALYILQTFRKKYTSDIKNYFCRECEILIIIWFKLKHHENM